MSTRGHTGAATRAGSRAQGGQALRLVPMARAIALTLAAGGAIGDAQAQRAFSPDWFAAKGAAQNAAAATGKLPNGMPVSQLASPQEQQQRASAQLQRSIDNLNLAARGIAAQQAAQAAAREAALKDGAAIPEGLAEGGLKVDTNALTAGWHNANAPKQTVADGKTTVAIDQSADRAILNWETFNVGKNTTVAFQQQKDWAVLNRVNDPNARPSQIQGQIKGDGTVMIVNRNGIVFNGSSQIDTRNLVAAAARIDDEQFRSNGIFSPGTAASFTNAQGKIEVQAGARIATPASAKSTEGGGYVLLLGKEVHNAGDIATLKGQAALAAGDSFVIKKGVGTDGNQGSTTRGNEVTPQFDTGSLAGKVTNTGLIVAGEGDITLAGRDVRQSGVALATITVNTRGTVHLNAVGSTGSVVLGPGATTAVVIGDDGKTTALDSQRDGLRGPAVASTENIVLVTDRRDQSRIEIASGGTADFQQDSLTLATGGQIVVNAAQRSLVRERARIDVAGAVGVNLAMESNNIKVNVQGNEQRDAPGNRDGKLLNSNDVWIDRRSLVFVPKGTNGYDSDRWYTAGGLLEVGGYLGTQGHKVGEWMAQGGTVSFGGNDVVTQAGSNINLSGGTLNVQTGFIRQTWLKGADGGLHEVSRAPGDQLYTGLYKGFEDEHKRWGEKATGYFYSPLIGAQRRLENGYTVGRDAGKLVIATSAAVLEGDIIGEAFQGARQTQAPQAALDGYSQSHNAAAARGELIVGQYLPMYDKRTGLQHHILGAVMGQVEFKDTQDRIAAGLGLGTALPADRQGKLMLDASQLNGFELGAIKIAARHKILVDADLKAAAGGKVTLYGNDVAVNAGITAHAGTIQLGNVLSQMASNGSMEDTSLPASAGIPAGVTVREGMTLDASGLWRNLLLNPGDGSGLPYRNGGSVVVRSSGGVVLPTASVIDVSSGAAVLANGKTQGGKGGDATLEANANSPAHTGALTLDGALRGHGVDGGGTLRVRAGKVWIGDAPHDTGTEPGMLVLGGGFFDKGFSAYDIAGKAGLTVADGARVDVTMPVYRFGTDAQRSDSKAGGALALWTPALYQEDPSRGVMAQRKGASLSLQAGAARSAAADMATVQAVIGRGAVINVDPGQALKVASIGQLTVDGTLNAWGGKIALTGVTVLSPEAESAEAAGHGRSIRIGEHAVLDAAARAVSATDARGQRYGLVRGGGSIVIGGEIDPATGTASAGNLFVVVREGALLDASGTQARLDIAGQGAATVASHGGSISLASNNGLYLDGTLKAAAGGAGAAGGTLAVALDAPLYRTDAAARVRQAREFILTQDQPAGQLPGGAGDAASGLAYGHARLGAGQVTAGGFDNLSILSNGIVSFDGNVSLSLGQSLNLYTGSLALADGAADASRIHLAAPYMRLAGVGAIAAADGKIRPTVRGGISDQASAGQLRIEAGGVLDLRDNLSVGARGGVAATEGLPAVVDRRAFDRLELVSHGDLRLLGGTVTGQNTTLSTPADLYLAAAQIYPAMGATATVRAGYLGTNSDFDQNRKLVIGRTADGVPAVPYSAFGTLNLGAAVIEQGGVLRAPLGGITIGMETSASRAATQSVRLLPGSLTSVSADGLVLPYGGTVDGVTWQYDGEQVGLLGAGGTSFTGVPRVSVTLLGRAIDVQRDAVLDLSGGGRLLGAAFVSGRGGSTDARYHPLMQTSAGGSFTLPGLATNPVYAIVPGMQPAVAPAGGEGGAGVPPPGQQVTIAAGVPGLPAGTYTLLPSTYALLPGAFRVEINGQAGAAASAASAVAMRNGSWSTPGQFSIAGTGIRDALSRRLVVTPADVLRTYSQYSETSFADFVRADAARVGVPRAALEADAKTLRLHLVAGNGAADDFNFNGLARFQPAANGFGGTLAVTSPSSDIEVLAAGVQPGAGSNTVSLHAADLNAVGAARMVIGGLPWVKYGQGGNLVQFDAVGSANAVNLRQGASLSAAEVFLISTVQATSQAGGIRVEQGASINTLGRGKAAYDSGDGFVYQPGNRGVLAVSNGRLQMLAPQSMTSGSPGSILVGGCARLVCAGTTSLYSEGTIAFATSNEFELGDAVRYGTRHLALAVGGINVGSAAALAAAAARRALPSGLTLNQDVMDRLLRGDTSTGAPALQTLSLTAAQSFNFYGDTTLSTLDASGKSLLDNLALTTPAIYGHGDAGDVARIRTGTLVWNGTTALPGAVVAEGAGTGAGTLDIQARRIEFGYGPDTQPDTVADAARLVLGFANVNLNASERVTANHKGSLAVYQAQGAYEIGKGFAYSGGNLNIATPLITGEAGSVNRITAGGAINVSAPAGSGAASAMPAIDALGAELALSGKRIVLDTTVVLPSGKLTLSADNDLSLANAARIDVAGRKATFMDVDKYSWGGDVILESRAGNIRQAEGSVIDLSAQHNQAGTLKAVAVAASAGLVDLQGKVLGGSSGRYDAGGTVMPYRAGGVDIRAQGIGDFAALNRRLNDGEVFGARSFQLKRGDLTIGDEIKAGMVNVSVDDGSLTVAGTIDASGERVGSIRLAGKNGLTIAGTALLDTHGSALRVDSYGKIIDAPNRALIELNSGNGPLTLASGARLDLRHGTDVATGTGKGQNDGVARGTLELNAPRIGSGGKVDDANAPTYGDLAIDARGSLSIRGARSIVVNATARYTDAPPGTSPAASGRPYQVIDQAYLDGKHADSTAFIDAALGNGALLNGKLAGLNNASYADAFHLRPGVEIVSKTPDGDLIVSGDLDLSGYRYAGVNPHNRKTAVYGSGEPGSLVIRAGGNLEIYGSINDGFAPPPATPDDNGWVLTPGRQAYGGDVVVPGAGVVLAEGTLFPAGKTLNYALPIQATMMASGTILPVEGTLGAPLELPANTVLRAAVRDSAGNVVYAAGTLVAEPVTLAAGMKLDAGTLLPNAASLAAMTWPAGVPLPGRASFNTNPDGVLLAGALPLKVGALIPSDTNVKLPGDALSVPLRTVTGASQGSNWAVAAMLPEGSLSWSMRLVSGADIQAADTRAIKPAFAGDLVLADTHYALYETHDKIVIPGTPARPGGAWYWNALGAELGFEPGTPVPASEESWCAVDACIRYNYVWNELGVLIDPAFTAGKPVEAIYESFCSEGVCTSLGEPIPAVPDRVIVGPVKQVSPISQHFSVLRTGTGNLDLIAAGNVAMRSAYGVYTAGVSTASLADAVAFDQARSRSRDGTTVLGSGGSAYEPLVNDSAGSPYAAWYPDHGGNVLVRAGGSLTGDIVSQFSLPRTEDARAQSVAGNLGNWLWRQGTGDTAGVDPIAASWWINFGTYVKEAGGANTGHPDRDIINTLPMLVGFTGVGTLGGGNLTVDVGGNAGMLDRRGSSDGVSSPRSEGLVLAVASTGRAAPGGQLLLTGGGDMDVRIGGDLNPGLRARAAISPGTSTTASTDFFNQNLNLNGVLTNLRGGLDLQTGSLGGIAMNYGGIPQTNDLKEGRAYNPFNATLGTATGGVVLMLGDAAANLSTRGDLVLSGTGDPGRISTRSSSSFTFDGKPYADGGYGWFSLWTDRTAIHLFSAGGNLTPSVQLGTVRSQVSGNASATDGRFLFPSQLSSVAANGSIFLGKSALGGQDSYDTAYSLSLAPAATGSLQLLAGDSIYASGYAVTQSGASLSALPTPFKPAFIGFDYYSQATGAIPHVTSNVASDAIRPTLIQFPLFAFGANTAAARAAGDRDPARFYAAQGDIVGLRTGEILAFKSGQRTGQTWYESAGPVWMMAGRDIVNAGTPLGQPVLMPQEIANTLAQSQGGGTSAGNLFVHNSPNDVSVVSAGRDILRSAFSVAGPGTLEISAGRNILMEDKAAVTSLGAVLPGDARPGAGIVMQAGLGARGADYAGFVKRYLDPANQAEAGKPLAAQPGKVAHGYNRRLALADWLRAEHGYQGEDKDAQAFLAALQAKRDADPAQPRRLLANDYQQAAQLHLVNWLETRYGFDGSEDALAFFNRLPPEQQRIYIRGVYAAELRAGGREHNDAGGARYGSYLRGRNAIAALFPGTDAQGKPIAYQGDITMYGAAGVNTLFGGDITMLTPGGHQVFGIEGAAPQPVAGVIPGVITQGAGNIHLYAQDHILLGQSRIMTTFGGHIMGWSAEGDINAGRGAKTTVVYTPPKRVYDQWGNVTLSSGVPSTGAGIATLNPIPEVPAGDVDLIAPLGTIDAGEAGIRVSGNVSLAALQVVNAANIAVQGQATGIPVVAAVNVSALANASAAASQASAAAQDALQRERATARQALPSIFTVRVIGFGNEPAQDDGAMPSAPAAGGRSGATRYDMANPVQLVGNGQHFDAGGWARLTDDERRQLRQDR